MPDCTHPKDKVQFFTFTAADRLPEWVCECGARFNKDPNNDKSVRYVMTRRVKTIKIERSRW